MFRQSRSASLPTRTALAACLAMPIALGACGDNLDSGAMMPDARPGGPNADGGNDGAPYAVDLFVRGNFNDWSTATPMTFIGNGRYQAFVRLSEGVHLFKIADADWSEDTTFSRSVETDLDFRAGDSEVLEPAPGGGNHTNLIVPATGVYVFELTADSSQAAAGPPANPVLSIDLDPAPYEVDLYVRGQFNNWGDTISDELRLVYYGQGRYRVTTTLEAGEHAFKIADADWSEELTFSASADDSVAVPLDEENTLERSAGVGNGTDTANNTRFALAADGDYTFYFVVSGDKAKPSLEITKAAEGEIAVINPHKNATETAEIQGLPGSGTVAIMSIDEDGDARTYALSSNQVQRTVGAAPYVKISETADEMTVRSGNLMFDGLFALAIDEVAQNAVSGITDGSYDETPCDCFETGEQWHYVWTRDLAYSVDLSLAVVDPVRSQTSLLFKVGNKRVHT